METDEKGGGWMNCNFQ